MTQTSQAASLNTLLDQAYDLAAAIGAAMDAIKNNDGPQQPDEWHDLKVAFDASGVITGQLYQMIKRQRAAAASCPECDSPAGQHRVGCATGRAQREADQPVPYTVPDDLDLLF